MRGGRRRSRAASAGNDVEVQVNLSFEDALKGVETKIPVTLEVACHTCHGSGAKPGTAPIVCPQCGGRGVVSESQGFFALSQPCPRCRGNGTIIEEPCPTCRGSGRERRTKRYTVKIPAGVKDGTRIRLKGKGEAGYGGAPAGDLYVVTRVEPSKLFTRAAATTSSSTCRSRSPRPRSARRSRCRRPDGARPVKVPAGSAGRQAAARQGPGRAEAEGLAAAATCSPA